VNIVDKILTKEMLVKERVENNVGIMTGLYPGIVGKDGTDILGDKTGVPLMKSNGEALESVITAKNLKWVNTQEYFELWNKIENIRKKLSNQYQSGRVFNIAQFPDDYYTLVDMIRMDITRRRFEEMDYTDRVAQEITNPAFSRAIRLDEFLPFSGAFLERDGRGESVPLIQQKTGETGTTSMHLYALGHERSLEDELYNLDIYSLQKVNAAVARAHTGARNALSIGQYVAYTLAGTWTADQQVPPTVNASYDMALYLTLKNAMRHLFALNDPQTLLPINASRIALIVGNRNDADAVNAVINGQIAYSREGVGAEAVTRVMQPLAIDEIWIYRGDTIFCQGMQVEYPGVPEGYAYLIVTSASDNANYILVKRGLTMEMGRGSVLNLAREQRAWYFAQTKYSKEHFGHTGGCSEKTGFCVEIELPVYNEET